MNSKYLRATTRNTLFMIIILAIACKKQTDWLDKKSTLSLVTPTKISDYQAIIDNSIIMNTKQMCVGQIGTDNLYISNENFNAITLTEQSLYTFQREVWENDNSYDWNYQYQVMEYANIVLDGIKDISPSTTDYNNVKGEALFYRAFSAFNLSQVFCKPYDPVTAKVELGIPIRTSSDVNAIVSRGTVEQTYNQMLEDAEGATRLLAKTQPYYTRPNLYAAYGLLAKIYLSMHDYKNAEVFSDKAISGNAKLMNYNDRSLVNPSAIYRFPSNPQNNPEILYYGSGQNFGSVVGYAGGDGYIDTLLYQSYQDNDLRKSCLYTLQDGKVYFTGSYTGSWPVFCGIGLNEMYLTKAECLARQGDANEAMSTLNTLLQNRYVTGTYTDKTISDPDSALSLILKERRKELPLSGNIRWEDLRRLNLDQKTQVTVIHFIKGTKYTLVPNDPKYTLPIPGNEIQLSGIEQNIR